MRQKLHAVLQLSCPDSGVGYSKKIELLDPVGVLVPYDYYQDNIHEFVVFMTKLLIAKQPFFQLFKNLLYFGVYSPGTGFNEE